MDREVRGKERAQSKRGAKGKQEDSGEGRERDQRRNEEDATY